MKKLNLDQIILEQSQFKSGIPVNLMKSVSFCNFSMEMQLKILLMIFTDIFNNKTVALYRTPVDHILKLSLFALDPKYL